MVSPPVLRKGDKIAILAPARAVTFAEIHPAIRLMNKYDLEVVLGSYVFSQNHQFAGTDDQRCRDFQQMLDDPEIRAILCARGGYGTVRFIDQLDFTRFMEHPKWIVGFSDITVLHAHIHQLCGVETLHAAMPLNIGKQPSPDTLDTLMNALLGAPFSYQLDRTPLARSGKGEGLLVGGNLSILYSLNGSVSMPDTCGKILFLEDVDEYLYHIDRMMVNLKRSGKLDQLSGLIVGGMTDMKDNQIPFGKTANEIIYDAVKEFDYPLCFDFPAGHLDNNLALVMGRKASLTVDREIDISFY